MFRYIVFVTVRFLVSNLPKWFVYWGAHRLADYNYILDRRGREAVMSNLRKILPPGTSEERLKFETRWVFRNFAKAISEFFGDGSFNEEFLDRRVIAKGMDNLTEAHARGKGVIVASAHFGNWELGAAFMAKQGYKVWAITQTHAHPRVNALFVGQRRARNYDIIPMEKSMRPIRRILADGGVLCILAERNLSDKGVPVEFFGHEADFPQGPARLALSTGAPIVPVFSVRMPSEGFTYHFEPAIEVPKTGSRSEKVAAMTQDLARVIEKYIRWHPSQWGVFYKVWEEDPPGKMESKAMAGAAPVDGGGE